ncbi:MAG: hypothetical protein IJD28_02320 [Deferribacterales bacterium]|nr:hypothetical protein [Deferribacterales bacterium]
MESKLRILTAAIFCIFITLGTSFGADRPSHIHEVYFEGTNFELHIFRINGRTDGSTMLIIGGIQGDEPGGFLSADLYSDLALEKGNLIVVPRANLKSVILFNRGPDGDMNRLFTDENYPDIQGEVVQKLKELMSQADILLNLHDGWGFHYPEYVDKSRNPNRFGQSIIIDEAEYSCNGKTLELKTMAEAVLAHVNSKIEDKNMHLHLFNTETGNENSRFKDMRKTATWYALTSECIPAFGIEGSKNVKSIEKNVLYHNYAVNEFMKIMDIVPEQPRIMIIKPEMESVIIRVNDRSHQLKSGDTLHIDFGDEVEVAHVESNYTRGVTCDILGYGTLNDLGKSIKIKGDTKIIFRKDNEKMSEINIKTRSLRKTTKYGAVLIKLNGEYQAVLNNSRVVVPSGSEIELVSFLSGDESVGERPINLKGWVPFGAVQNSGDDRGYKITLPHDAMLKKYSLDGDGKVYPVIVGADSAPDGVIYLEIN